jgi:hypothetical protein
MPRSSVGVLCARDVIKRLTPLLLVLARDAISQNKAELPTPRIVVDHLSSKDRQFSFNVRIAPIAGDNRTAVLTVTCDPGLFCSPGQQTISLSKPNPEPFTAQSVRLNYLGKNSCQVNIAVSSAKGILARPHISLAVKPLWWTSFLVCLLGCIIQYFLAWLLDIEETQPGVPLWGWKATVGKGVLAFIFAFVLSCTTLQTLTRVTCWSHSSSGHPANWDDLLLQLF